jgi:hypothetical protein
MKKLMTLVMAVAMMAVCGWAGSPRYSGEVVVAAGATNGFDQAVLGDLVGPFAGGCLDLDEFKVYNVSGTGTGTVTLLESDIGVETQLYNAGSHIPGYSTVSYPRRTQERSSTAGWVVTNDLIVAKASVVSDYEKYTVRTVKIKVAQPVSATPNVYRWCIKAK